MTIEVFVTNTGPQTTREASKASLDLFQRYTQQVYNSKYDPFEHQAQVFEWVEEQDKAVMLIAGTAAGKTLAIGVPLFHKLATGRIQRVLLMYPTIALMNDQSKVMNVLADLTGLEIGHIQGGMKRTALISALNKPVIVATPDAIYWFFQKSIKYSALLIYGLALVDEFVLDEAHLFNGLMLQNIQHLKKRITTLSHNIGRTARWHVLTATPTPALRTLSDHAQTLNGKSKCSDVTVIFNDPVDVRDFEQRNKAFVQAVNESITHGSRKVLLVLNSAAAAHRMFEDIRGEQPLLPVVWQMRFGTVAWGELRRWMINNEVDQQIIAAITRWIEHQGDYYLCDIQSGTTVDVSTETLMATVSHALHKAMRNIKDAAYTSRWEVDQGSHFTYTLEKKISKYGQATQALWIMTKGELSGDADPDEVKQALNQKITAISETLEQAWRTDKLSLLAPDFSELMTILIEAKLPLDLAHALKNYLYYNTEVEIEDVQILHKPRSVLDKRHIPLRWLEAPWLIEDEGKRSDLYDRVKTAIIEKTLNVETRHIASWTTSSVPAVIYTGQMSKRDRKGLIEVFDAMDQAILVSTPAVEVGVDFKADTLITEECDGNGFLQRFGRVGRAGGGEAQVIVLLREGHTWQLLERRSQPKMTREVFSRMIIDPLAPDDPDISLFPNRTYAKTSVYLDATHWLINRELGRIGEQLNETMFKNSSVADLARQMEAADVPFAYGLRGTLPGVSMLGGGGGDPFYILSKVQADDLKPSSSPFEIAEAQINYMRFLYSRRVWDIQVDWKRTLSASRAMFYKLHGEWEIVTGYGVADVFIRSSWLIAKFRHNLTAMRQKLASVKNPQIQEVLRLGKALELHNRPQRDLILGQGDVFLQRVERESGTSTLVVDRFNTPIVLNEQLWLYIQGNPEKIWKELQRLGLHNLTEVHYPDDNANHMLLLDRIAGGCFYIYERIVQDAN